MHRFSLVVASGAFSLVALLGFKLVASHCGAQALGAWAQYLCGVGLVALWHVVSSWTRDQTHCPLHWQADF